MKQAIKVSKEILIKNILLVERNLGRIPMATDMKKPFSKYTISLYKVNFGSWNKALALAGLGDYDFEDKRKSKIRNLTEEELLENLNEVKNKLGRVPNCGEIKKPLSKFTSTTYILKFGSWAKTLEKAGLKSQRKSHISDEALIDNFKEVALKLGRTPTVSEFKYPLTKYPVVRYYRQFGSWKEIILKAGLTERPVNRITDEELIENLKEVEAEKGKTPMRKEMKKPLSKYSEWHYIQRFGSWKKAIETAGLLLMPRQYGRRYGNITDEELLLNLKEVEAKTGKTPVKREMKKPLSKYSDWCYVKRFGSWSKALEALNIITDLD